MAKKYIKNSNKYIGGIEVDSILPSLSRIGNVRQVKKKNVINKIYNLVQKFLGI